MRPASRRSGQLVVAAPVSIAALLGEVRSRLPIRRPPRRRWPQSAAPPPSPHAPLFPPQKPRSAGPRPCAGPPWRTPWRCQRRMRRLRRRHHWQAVLPRPAALPQQVPRRRRMGRRGARRPNRPWLRRQRWPGVLWPCRARPRRPWPRDPGAPRSVMRAAPPCTRPPTAARAAGARLGSSAIPRSSWALWRSASAASRCWRRSSSRSLSSVVCC
mmetsp:Transcript_8197/g.23448  ORF Transcript_8197/g.23448 Transcript_8197/m.23448 type:complete len:214 (-) Transcript_8197:182-823(-)